METNFKKFLESRELLVGYLRLYLRDPDLISNTRLYKGGLYPRWLLDPRQPDSWFLGDRVGRWYQAVGEWYRICKEAKREGMPIEAGMPLEDKLGITLLLAELEAGNESPEF